MKTFYCKTCLLVRLLVFCFNGYAQNNLPPVYEIKTDTVLTQYLDSSYWQLLEDKAGKLTFEQVIKSSIENQFHYNKTKISNTNLTKHSYWFRYILKNAMDHNAKICFGFAHSYVLSDFYFIDDQGKVTQQVNGLLSPWSKLNGIKEYKVIPVELKAGEKVIVYNRIYYSPNFPFPLIDTPVGFSSTEKVMQQIYAQSQTAYFNAIHDMFIVGVLAFASLFSFMFFIIVREKVYLYFSFYLFSLTIGRFNINFEMLDVFFREDPRFYAYIFNIIWFFSIFFLTHFIRYLLNTKYHLPKWDKFLVAFNIAYAVTYLLSVIVDFTDGYNVFLRSLYTYEQIVLALSILVTFFMSVKWFKNKKVLIFIVLPLQSIWSITWSIAIYSLTFGVTTIPWLQGNWYGFETILLCCLVTSFSWILLNRFGELKKQIIQKELEKEIERSQLIEQQKTALEKTVEERTAELKQSLENLKSTQLIALYLLQKNYSQNSTGFVFHEQYQP